jgi:hypothetical protein
MSDWGQKEDLLSCRYASRHHNMNTTYQQHGLHTDHAPLGPPTLASATAAGNLARARARARNEGIMRLPAAEADAMTEAAVVVDNTTPCPYPGFRSASSGHLRYKHLDWWKYKDQHPRWR